MRRLLIDVGNTHIVFGICAGDRMRATWRVQTVHGRTADEYGVLFRTLLEDLPGETPEAAVLASVVPSVTEVVAECCQRRLHLEPLVIGPGVRTGMPILYDKPQDVGADRIVNAVAAFARTETATIIVDFGTTTVFDYVSERGEYLGGVICPGPRIAAEILASRAARLYRVELRQPTGIIGHNTIESVQSGLTHGHTAMVDGIVKAIVRERGRARVIATGGLARILAQGSTTIDDVDEDLTMHGLRIIHERNARDPSATTRQPV